VDALYLFRHSVYGDVEIRYSLRSLAKYAPYIRKVWIFGDWPAFLSDDASVIEHVPHSYVTRSGSFRTPVSNAFLMLYLSSLIPELDSEYLRFSDDYHCGERTICSGGWATRVTISRRTRRRTSAAVGSSKRIANSATSSPKTAGTGCWE